MTLELETDSPQAGPKGRLSITLSKGCIHPLHGVCDAPHDPLVKLYTVETDEVSIGGRSGGGDTGIVRRSASVDIPDNVARQVTHISVQAECTGSSTEWSGWTSLQNTENAFEATGRPAGATAAISATCATLSLSFGCRKPLHAGCRNQIFEISWIATVVF